MIRGFLLGKFMPLHKGHQALVEFARQQCDVLTVLVCSQPSESIVGYYRYNWMKTLFPNNVRVKWYWNEVQQEPNGPDDTNFWNIWKGIIKKEHPEQIHRVFSSEDYGYKLAEVLGAEHIQFDKNRANFPVSGTLVRENPYKQWRYLDEVVRPYFVKNILVTGPESCGKSIVTAQLADHFQTCHVKEYAREYIEELDRPFTAKDLGTIAFRHLEEQRWARKKANKIFFTDTDAVVTKVYSEHYFNEVHQFVKDAVYVQAFDFVLLMKPDLPWEHEKQRISDELRPHFYNLFEKSLMEREIPYAIIDGIGEERLNKAIKAVEPLLS